MKERVIYKITADATVDFAASELKKYLRMMMPESGDVSILYNPEAKDGFRLGLMQDFGLAISEVQDPALDDLLYIETDEWGGVIAGDNPRSVLLAVYEYLRQNGCRFLFPGIEGETVPLAEVKPVSYRHKASCRYRGPCIEGACSQEILLNAIDFLPKAGMNTFQMQFFVPTVFYQRYYEHKHNDFYDRAVPSEAQMLQWKIAAEAEMAKRGIMLHDVGHGWTAAPFGVDITSGWGQVDGSKAPEWGRKYYAEINGERKIFNNVALLTQICMSSPEARKILSEYIADYASRHTNIDYLHVWLGDAVNNHCECEQCRDKTVSDWYVLLLNDIDAVLTAKGLATRIVFIGYYDTVWAPTTERIQNPDRFAFMLAPMTRSYTKTLTGEERTTDPFVRNKLTPPPDLDGYLAYYRAWRRMWDGAVFAYEYHFWEHQAFDPSGLFLADRVFYDIEAYKQNGIDGMIAAGSQRSVFPTGFAYYVYARKLYDISLSLDTLYRDYFSTAFGDKWEEVVAYLRTIGDCFGDKLLEGEESIDTSRSPYYNPQRAERLRGVKAVTEEGRALLSAVDTSRSRLAAVSVEILRRHTTLCDLLAETFSYKANGEDEKATAAATRMIDEMNLHEVYIERYYDYYLTVRRFGYLCGAGR